MKSLNQKGIGLTLILVTMIALLGGYLAVAPMMQDPVGKLRNSIQSHVQISNLNDTLRILLSNPTGPDGLCKNAFKAPGGGPISPMNTAGKAQDVIPVDSINFSGVTGTPNIVKAGSANKWGNLEIQSIRLAKETKDLPDYGTYKRRGYVLQIQFKSDKKTSGGGLSINAVEQLYIVFLMDPAGLPKYKLYDCSAGNEYRNQPNGSFYPKIFSCNIASCTIGPAADWKACYLSSHNTNIPSGDPNSGCRTRIVGGNWVQESKNMAICDVTCVR